MNSITIRDSYVREFIPAAFRGVSLADYKGSSDTANAVRQAVRDYIDNFFTNRNTIVLYGPSSAGKTLLASVMFLSIGSVLADRREEMAVYSAQTADNLVWLRGDELPGIWKKKADDHGDARSAAELAYHMTTAGLAVLDDIDKCPCQENWGAQLFGLIDARLCDHRLPTVITMNHTPAEFAKRYVGVGPQIIERIRRTGGVFVRVDKQDY